VQASELSFPVVFHKQNCAVHSGNPTVSSVYLLTPRWHHLKALNFPKCIKDRRPLRSSKCTDRYLNFGTQKIFFFSYNIMADVASKQRTTALFLSAIVTRTRRHIELTKKTDKPDGKPALCQRTFSSVFRAVFLHS
jgi:hypothetical protein